MEKPEVRKLLEQIVGLYPNIKLSPDTANIWAECLGDISFTQARNNLIEHVKNSRFIPTIAEIRGTAQRKNNNIGNYCEVTGEAFEIYEPPEHDLN